MAINLEKNKRKNRSIVPDLITLLILGVESFSKDNAVTLDYQGLNYE